MLPRLNARGRGAPTSPDAPTWPNAPACAAAGALQAACFAPVRLLPPGFASSARAARAPPRRSCTCAARGAPCQGLARRRIRARVLPRRAALTFTPVPLGSANSRRPCVAHLARHAPELQRTLPPPVPPRCVPLAPREGPRALRRGTVFMLRGHTRALALIPALRPRNAGVAARGSVHAAESGSAARTRPARRLARRAAPKAGGGTRDPLLELSHARAACEPRILAAFLAAQRACDGAAVPDARRRGARRRR